MAFEIAIEADPLQQQVAALLTQVTGVGSQLQSSTEALRELTINATNFLSSTIQQGFGALANDIEDQVILGLGPFQDAVEQASIEERRRIESIGTALDVATQTTVLAGQAQLDAVLRQLGLTGDSIKIEIAETAAQSESILDTLLGNAKDAILGIPDEILGPLSPLLGSIIGQLTDQETALGGGFGFLGAANILGFSQLTDVITNIFNIDPQDFLEGFKAVIPAMVEATESIGNTILEAD